MWRLRRAAANRPAGPTPAPGAPRPVVYLPTWAQWGVMQQRPQYLVGAFAKAGHDTWFVDPREPRERVVDGVRIVPSLASVPGEHVILYVHFAPLRELFDHFTDPAIVYDIFDDLSIFEPDEGHLPPGLRVAAHHGAVVERADLVIASHPLLVERHHHEAPDILLVENGVEVGRFTTPSERPADFPTGPGPVVGYHGMHSYWFDFDLLADLARLRPSWTFALVGPVDPRAESASEAVADLPNVHLLGERPSDVIASYVQAFDVGIIPWRIDRMVEAVSPLKMYEFFAAGVPVVSVPIPAAVEHPVVRTANTAVGFAEQIEVALAGRATAAAAMAQAAEEADWSHRVEAILGALDRKGLRRVPS